MSAYTDSGRKYTHGVGITNSFPMFSNTHNTETSLRALRKHSSRRHSDTPLVVSPLAKVQEQEASLSNSLPTCDSQGVVKIFTKLSLNTAGAHDLLSLDNKVRPQIQKIQAPAVTAKNNSETKVSEKLSFYGRVSSKIFGSQKIPKKLSSSDPDISTAESYKYPHHIAHFDRCDCGPDLSPLDVASGSDKSKNTPTKILNIFSTILHDSQYQNRRRQENKEQQRSRKYSMDSQMIVKKKQHHARAITIKPSTRTIKIASPGQTNALYISGADTLGGLPDEEDSRSLQQKHLLASLDCHSSLCRRSSCPVIFESEETEEGVNSRRPSVSSNVRRGSALASFAHSSDELSNNHTTSSSSFEEISDKNASFKTGQSQSSRHFYVGSDSLDGNEDSENSGQPTLLEGVTFIVNKPKEKNREKLDTSTTVQRTASSSHSKPSSPKKKQVKNVMHRRNSRQQLVFKEDKLVSNDAGKCSATDKLQTSKEKGETDCQVVKTSVARTDSILSSSLTEDDESFNLDPDKVSETSSADESAS